MQDELCVQACMQNCMKHLVGTNTVGT